MALSTSLIRTISCQIILLLLLICSGIITYIYPPATYGAQMHTVTITLRTLPVFNPTTHTFTLHGEIANLGSTAINESDITLTRSSRIDSNNSPVISPSLTLHPPSSNTNSEPFTPQFISHFSRIIPPLAAHSSAPFTLSFSTLTTNHTSTSHKHNAHFLNLPSPGVYAFSVYASYTIGKQSQLHTTNRDIFTYVFLPPTSTAQKSVPEQTSPIPSWSHHVLPAITFISFHLPPQTPPGYLSNDQHITLSNDQILSSLISGHLATTLHMAESLSTKNLCLALDPDLMRTISTLRRGYSIDDKYHGGSTEARIWLDKLATLAKNTCVVSEPFSNTDLNFFSQPRLSPLLAIATSGAEILSNILHIPVRKDILYINHQVLSPATVTALHAAGITTIIGRTTRPCFHCIPITYAPQFSHDTPDKNIENALAHLTDLHFLSQHASITHQPLIVGIDSDSPAQDEQAALIVHALTSAYSHNQFTYLPFDTLLGTPSTTFTPSTHLLATQFFIPNFSTLYTTERTLGLTDDLIGLSAGTISQDYARTFYAPLKEDILRAYSVISLRDLPAQRASHTRHALHNLHDIEQTLSFMSNKIRILTPSTSFALASNKSPLIVTIKNELPLAIKARLAVKAPPGFIVKDTRTVVIPASSELQLKLRTYSAFSRYTSILVQLQSSSGTLFNKPVQISIYANAYGHWFYILSIITGSVLILLVIWRLYRRLTRGNTTMLRIRPEPSQKHIDETVSPQQLKKVASANELSQRHKS